MIELLKQCDKGLDDRCFTEPEGAECFKCRGGLLPATPAEIVEAARQIETAEIIRRSNEPGVKFIPGAEVMQKLDKAIELNKDTTFFERTADAIIMLDGKIMCGSCHFAPCKNYCQNCGTKLIGKEQGK